MDKQNENLVAYCGLYCGDCFSFRGAIADLSRDLRKELRQAKFDNIAKGIPFKEFKNYKEKREINLIFSKTKEGIKLCFLHSATKNELFINFNF